MQQFANESFHTSTIKPTLNAVARPPRTMNSSRFSNDNQPPQNFKVSQIKKIVNDFLFSSETGQKQQKSLQSDVVT